MLKKNQISNIFSIVSEKEHGADKYSLEKMGENNKKKTVGKILKKVEKLSTIRRRKPFKEKDQNEPPTKHERDSKSNNTNKNVK
ncbi:hypothetical protein QEJ31_14700 [Pigmentibacter sp. JX0631]|uniref:hypothetical protein n=1 Tax=Pigmentibacter sp. JX0631 TaxID=2976982 RepID=UPI002468D118|nr:hypothetical protein [Pigmentibacter sp. JX0631]WGL59779.1 hypothetical protein QEJ31_14700 [Pigmentibacter sp. JX0631]